MIPMRRRFWQETAVAPGEGGFLVLLDGRPVNTPRAAPLRLPARALAAAVAAEWGAVAEEIRPETMPMTRLAVGAIDQVAADPGPLAATVAAYGESDLVCYRAAGPEALSRRQAERWDPVLDWADLALGAPLVPVEGLMHRRQPEASVARLREAVAGRDAFRLAGLAELVALSGSLVIGLAVAEGALAPEEAWALSRVDEDWQAEQWGVDAEAEAAAARARGEFLEAARFLRLLEDG